MTEEDRDALGRYEAELRSRGLPLVVHRDGRGLGSAIVPRAAPALAFLMLIDPLTSLLATLLAVSDAELERRLSNSAWVFGLLAITVAVLVVPVLVGWLVSRWLAALQRTGQLVLAGTVLVLATVVLPVVESATGLRSPLWLGFVISFGGALIVLAGVYVGAGSILGWSLRRAFQQLGKVGTMATRALPLLVLVVLFAFFSTEMWQIAEALPRWRLWLVVALLAALSVLFTVAMLHEALGKMLRDAEDEHLGALPAKLADLAADLKPGKPAKLRRSEWTNLMLVLFVAQAIQIVLLTVLVFCLLVGLGALAVDKSVIEAWLGQGTFRDPGTLFGLELPLPKALVHVSIFLAMFAGLYFTASTATDDVYSSAFFKPLVEDVRESLAVRQAYLARRADRA